VADPDARWDDLGVQGAAESLASAIARGGDARLRGRAGLRAAANQLIPPAIVLFVLPFTAIAVRIVLQRHALAVDFHYAFWPAARRVLHGLSPYVDPHSPIVAGGAAFVYPAPAALLMAPFGLLGRETGDAVFALINVAALMLALRVLGVRDLRVYAIAFMSNPVFSAWQTANITLLLALGLAVAWRRRDNPWIAGIALALVVSVKLFLWPVGLWLLATRRYRAVAYGVAFGIAVNAVSWLVLGVDELGRYSRLTSALTHAEERRAYTVVSFALNHGVSRSLAYTLGLSIAAAVACACLVAGRRGRDESALLLAIVTSLLATPLVWVHYLALLIVPIAIARPRLTPLWGLLFILWLCPPTRPTAIQWAIAIGVAAAVVTATLRAFAANSRRVVAT
jgi:hypothetical protein